MATETAFLIFIILVALTFDFLNGFHDAANSIATVVSTRVLKPHQAVIWAALFNVIAIFVFQLKVATTIGKGTIGNATVASRKDRRAISIMGNSIGFRGHNEDIA